MLDMNELYAMPCPKRIYGDNNMPEDTNGIFKSDAKTIIKVFGDVDSYY